MDRPRRMLPTFGSAGKCRLLCAIHSSDTSSKHLVNTRELTIAENSKLHQDHEERSYHRSKEVWRWH
ncbi:hypothetical protein Mapa_013183 [Marchantia paleacea]|nr:hypothetical protein Mapa_013183 [Marchantia paleacea]